MLNLNEKVRAKFYNEKNISVAKLTVLTYIRLFADCIAAVRELINSAFPL